MKYDISRHSVLDWRNHERHGLSIVNVNERRGRRDRGCAIVVRRYSAERPVVVDGGENEADLVLDVLVVRQRRPGPRLLWRNGGYLMG